MIKRCMLPLRDLALFNAGSPYQPVEVTCEASMTRSLSVFPPTTNCVIFLRLTHNRVSLLSSQVNMFSMSVLRSRKLNRFLSPCLPKNAIEFKIMIAIVSS